MLRAEWDPEVNRAAGRAGHGMRVDLRVHVCMYYYIYSDRCVYMYVCVHLEKSMRQSPGL